MSAMSLLSFNYTKTEEQKINVPLYIRAGLWNESELIIKAGNSVNHEALTKREGGRTYSIPTISFAININLEEEMFAEAERVITNINLSSEEVETCDVVRVMNP